MRLILASAALLALGSFQAALAQPAAPDAKQAMAQAIDARADGAWEAALKIWRWAEPGYHETQSAALLSERLEQAGFTVRRGVAEIPTAFVAEKGQGQPVLAILGEYDALPGLAQEATPQRRPPADNSSYGHGCGHHLFGVASAEAAIAAADELAKAGRPGTIRFYGCPAEEGGSAKAFMVRAGLFNDCAAALHWHPSSGASAGDRTCLARIAVKFRFHGKAAHAGGAPEEGRSALDAVELTNHAAELLREHTPEYTRIHHVITQGGDAPNVVPSFAEVFFYIRHPKAETARELYPRLLKCAQAGALATETKLEVKYLGGTMELVPNQTLAGVTFKNLQRYHNVDFDDQELLFIARIQETLADPRPVESAARVYNESGQLGKGSTDVGDVSWVVPTAGFQTCCWAPGTPGHSWQAVAAGGTTIGRKGMLVAAKTLAATAWDLATQPSVIAAAQQEQQRHLQGQRYQPLLEPKQAPPLDYRDPPRREAPQP